MDRSSEQSVYEFDDYSFDSKHLMLYRHGEAIPLTPKAAEILRALIQRQGDIVSKDELMELVWPETAVEESNVFLYMSQLRKLLGNRSDGCPYVDTFRRRGYRFSGVARPVSDDKKHEHYAWLVDLDGKGESTVLTESGRMYMLRDPLLGDVNDGVAPPEFPSEQTSTDRRPNSGPPQVQNRARLLFLTIAAVIAIISMVAYILLD